MDVVLERDRLTQDEAVRRASQVSNVDYQVELWLTAASKTYEGECVVTFDYAGEDDIFLDFVGSVIDGFEVNGREADPEWHENRIVLRRPYLQDQNQVKVKYVNQYDHTGEGFHQFIDPEDGSEYLYTQLEPFAAHRVFPCFDQPDLKASFAFTVTAPTDWEVTTAAPVAEVTPTDTDRSRRMFEPTVRISPYLTSVVVGPYHSVHDDHNGLPLGIYVRASMAQYLDADEIFAVTKAGLDYFAEFFGHPYPFSKYDQVFVPEFNWGGMENAGNVTYTDNLIFRDPPTSTQLLDRAEILLHELAHMWFGDLVTMKWWNDIWLNESFASYMAFRALEDATEFGETWQYFQTRMKLWAYQEDQLPTTHKIANEVLSTDETFLNFDGITYGKGASALKQLVAAVGEEVFEEGVKEYFRDYAFGNATLADFLRAIQLGAGTDLTDWSRLWLEAPSLNTLAARWDPAAASLEEITVVQTAPDDFPTLRPHTVELGIIGGGSGPLRVTSKRVTVSGAEQTFQLQEGIDDPLLVYPNYRDLTFAKVRLDEESVRFARTRLDEVDDSFFRQMLWATLWDMTRDARFSPIHYLELVESKLVLEGDLQIIRFVMRTAVAALSRYVPDALIPGAAHKLFNAGLRALDTASPGDARVLWFRSMLSAAESAEDLATAAAIVDGDRVIESLSIDQNMRWSVAVRWAGFGIDGWKERAARESERDRSDRGKRQILTVETSERDAEVKQLAWDRIHGDGYGSLHMDIAAMGGFNWRVQAALLEPFSGEFFDRLLGVFETREHEAAKAYFVNLWPHYRVDHSVIDRARAVLEKAEAPQLRRLLIEEIDRVERALRVRKAAETL